MLDKMIKSKSMKSYINLNAKNAWNHKKVSLKTSDKDKVANMLL